MFLEVIAKSMKDVEKINKSLANRIELCANLEVGGLTPDYNLVVSSTNQSKLPVNVIVRPTHRDFIYSKSEKKQIIKDIKFIRKTEANGIVFGALNKDNTIDLRFLKKVIKVKKHLEITFHKAFDEVNDFEKEYSILNELKVNTILTSGGQNLKTGINVIKRLIDMKLNTNILIGGGVNISNLNDLLNLCQNIHIGRLARKNNNYNEDIDVNFINSIKNMNT
ncbi:copper homeostasis protein [Spiroplasma gladiatoris]|uniref:Copper homeostasis protein cutC homolog n=1 Tax=Spiroplasma gladiatoris TaxID=2143 RepID=A0A4P7AHX3_9MOLU|nr:copper homeostasis protein CutC [Spiroplasma gladiatoris]QBQ08055.1 copper homeostasis protein [Spiroplasma gladiatoris]